MMEVLALFLASLAVVQGDILTLVVRYKENGSGDIFARKAEFASAECFEVRGKGYIVSDTVFREKFLEATELIIGIVVTEVKIDETTSYFKVPTLYGGVRIEEFEDDASQMIVLCNLKGDDVELGTMQHPNTTARSWWFMGYDALTRLTTPQPKTVVDQ